MERNYNVYLNGMEKGKVEKLFFAKYLKLGDYNVIIDFGCGSGDIIKFCKENSGLSECYGVDKDPFMRNVASDNCKGLDINFVESLDKISVDNPNAEVLIIFSSVLHEVGNYWNTIRKFINNYIGRITVVVRDMWFWDKNDGEIKKSDLAKIIKNSNPQRLSEFVEKYGLTTQKQMYHYLLKYSYVDNWELELEEDYFSFDWTNLNHGIKFYDGTYLLEYKKERVKQDFNIDLEFSTHRQLIVKILEAV